MNTLSWLIYLAEVVPSFASLLYAVGFLSIVGFSFYAFVGCVLNGDEDNQWWYKAMYLPTFKQAAFVFCIFFVSALLPSKETIYLVAGSEAGGTVVASEEGKKILSDIKEIIEIQMNKLKQ